MKSKLSRVYLDDLPVRLMGDEARPHLSRIVRAGGKAPDQFDVRWLTSPSDPKGLALDPEEILDRTLEPTKPIYLRTVPRASDPGATGTGPPSARKPPRPAEARTVIDQLGADPDPLPSPVPGILPDALDLSEPVRPRLYRGYKEDSGKALAEAEAEERQEEQRNAEDLEQDEMEALDEAARDDH